MWWHGWRAITALVAMCCVVYYVSERLMLGSKIETIREPGQFPPRVHFISHRSCSQDPNDGCTEFHTQMDKALTNALNAGKKNEYKFELITHVYKTLPEELISTYPSKYTKRGVKGRGYWFWKPAIVNMLLRNGTIKDGERVVYIDGDWACRSERELPCVLDRMDPDVDVTLNAGNGESDQEYTKGDIFHHFGVSVNDTHYGRVAQIWAKKFGLKVNRRSRQFMLHWENLMKEFHLVSDEPSVQVRNHRIFHENRHDQSMLSMLWKANTAQPRHPVYGVDGLRIKAFPNVDC